MRRRFAEYGPAARRSRPELFRSAELNAAGWSAVAALCLAGAAVGYGVGLVVALPVGVGPVAGATLALGALVAVDRRRWGRIWTGYSWDGAPEAVQRIASELTRRGLLVEARTNADGRVGLCYRLRDRRHVARELVRLGIRPPCG